MYIKFISSVSIVFVLSIFSCKETEVPAPTVPVGTTLKAANPAVRFGSLVYINSSKTPSDLGLYKSLIYREFNACQAAWFPGYNIGWLGPNKYDFTKFNENINFFSENKITPMMHVLFSTNQYEPTWLVNGNYTAAQLEELMKDMIDKIMESNDNKNKVEVWNVINELFDKNGKYQPAGTTKFDIIWNKMGYEPDKSGLSGADKINDQHPIFIRKAFEYCRLKTSKKLELRDNNIESFSTDNFFNAKHKGFYQLCKHMINSKIPLDAVGIQGHFDIGNLTPMINAFEIQQGYKRFKDLGLEVYVTELDIGSKTPSNATLLNQQKTDYYNYIKQAVKGGATIINTWGIRDNGEAGNWRIDEYPLLWDVNFNKKPAYDGALKALQDTRQ
jgi:endo-1,4-beta-xylanase